MRTARAMDNRPKADLASGAAVGIIALALLHVAAMLAYVMAQIASEIL